MLFSNRQQKFTFSHKLFFVLEAELLNTHNLYSFGWTELKCLHNFLTIVNSTELIWNQFCSSARFSQDTPRRPKSSWKKNKFTFTDSKDRIICMSMYNDIDACYEKRLRKTLQTQLLKGCRICHKVSRWAVVIIRTLT